MRILVKESIIATYLIISPDPDKLPLDKCADALADEQGLGLRGLPNREEYYNALKDYVVEVIDIIEVKRGVGIVKLAFPTDHLDYEIVDIPNILNLIAGDAFGSRYVKKLKLIDVDFPESLIKSFPGPKFGIEGIRKIVGEKKLPLIGVIIKPSLGLKPEKVAEIVYKAGIAGAHIIKDDEKYSSTKYSRFSRKMKVISKSLRKVEEETGREVLYAINITGKLSNLVERAKKAIQCGLNALMVPIITMGFGALRMLAESDEINVPLYAHRTMHASFTRDQYHGITMRVINKLTRLAGADFQHIGAMIGSHKEPIPEIKIRYRYVTQPWYNIKPSMPVLSAGIHPGNIEANMRLLKENDVLFMVGRGVYFYKGDVEIGVKALVQAVIAAYENKPIEEAMNKFKELKKAIEILGYY